MQLLVILVMAKWQSPAPQLHTAAYRAIYWGGMVPGPVSVGFGREGNLSAKVSPLSTFYLVFFKVLYSHQKNMTCVLLMSMIVYMVDWVFHIKVQFLLFMFHQYLVYRYLTASFRQHQSEISTISCILDSTNTVTYANWDDTSLPVLVSLWYRPLLVVKV